MTTRARLRIEAHGEDPDWVDPRKDDEPLFMEQNWPCEQSLLTVGDAHKLLAHHDALAALYAHAKLRPANDAETFGAWAATWMDLNTAEQDAWTALTTDPEVRDAK